MKKFYYTLFFIFLIISCSKDTSFNEIIEDNNEDEEINQPPNSFDIEVLNISHENATINWSEATDPENDKISYDIYLNQTLIIENTSELTYQLINLEELTYYSGKIIAKDTNNNKTEKTFSFHTEKYYLKYLKKYNYGEYDYGPGGYALGGPSSMIKTKDLNYVIAGASSFPNGSGFRLFVMKIDYEGNEVWKKFYDYNLTDGSSPKIINSSTGFLLVSHHHVLNLDNEGNIIWYKKIDSYDIPDGSADIESVGQDSAGNIFLVGGRGSNKPFPSPSQVAVLTKLNNLGSILWEKVFDTSYRSFFNDILITDTDEVIILGSLESSNRTFEEISESNNEEIDFWVTKLTNNGELIWENTFGDGKTDFPNQIISTLDNNFIAVGYGPSIFKVNQLGELLWSKTELSGNSPTPSISITSDNGFITTGKFVFGNYGALAISRYDSNGNLEWEKSYQETHTYLVGHAVLAEDDGGYRIAGGSSKNYYYGDDKPSLLIFKTDPLGSHK